LVYALNLKFNPGNFVFRGSYAKGFKAPSLKQLYLVFIDNNHKIYGSEDLLPEIADNFSLSADYLWQYNRSAIEPELSLFYNSSKNAIQLAVDINNPGWGKYFNVASTYRTQGMETSISFHYRPYLTLQVGYSLTGRSRLDNPTRFEYSGDIASSMTYQNNRYNFILAVFYKYTDDYLDFNGNFDAQGEMSGIAQRYVKSYNMMDLTLTKPLFQNRLTISIGAKNLFDIKLVESSGTLNYHGSGDKSTAVGYGRTYFLKLNFQIDKY
jgi:outer membrane receptor for ferrienterochelin and colicins